MWRPGPSVRGERGGAGRNGEAAKDSGREIFGNSRVDWISIFGGQDTKWICDTKVEEDTVMTLMKDRKRRRSLGSRMIRHENIIKSGGECRESSE